MITHTHPVASNLPIETLVARGLQTNLDADFMQCVLCYV